MHSELLLMGELQSRYKDKLAELPWLRARDEELEILHATYRDEIMSKLENLKRNFYVYIHSSILFLLIIIIDHVGVRNV